MDLTFPRFSWMFTLVSKLFLVSDWGCVIASTFTSSSRNIDADTADGCEILPQWKTVVSKLFLFIFKVSTIQGGAGFVSSTEVLCVIH